MEQPCETDANKIEAIVEEHVEKIQQLKRKITDAFENTDYTQKNNSKRLKRDLEQLETIIKFFERRQFSSNILNISHQKEELFQEKLSKEKSDILLNSEEGVIYKKLLEKFNALINHLKISKEYYQKQLMPGSQQYVRLQNANKNFQEFLISMRIHLLRIGNVFTPGPE